MYKTLKDVGQLRLKFNSCEGCKKNCCTAQGGFSLAPLILDDYVEVYERFPILFAQVGQMFKSVIILNNGEDDCIYFDAKTKLCTIYEHRPPACVMYPISPLFDEICVDTSCHAVSEREGEFLCDSQSFSKKFHHKRIDNFYEKLRYTQKFLNQIRFNTIKKITILGINLYQFDGQCAIDSEFEPYINMHFDSLKHIQNYKISA